jgi:uncharacterized cupin superfamily protein
MPSSRRHWQAVPVTTRAYDALSIDLSDLPLAPDDVRDGDPKAGSTTLVEALGVEVGVWELTAGTVTDTEVDEVFVVLAGAGSVTFEDGETLELRPGVVVRLRAGERTSWTITETLRKVWVAG